LFQIPVSKGVFVAASGIMSLLLVQAWCPEAALSWNFATWALSAVVFFYAMFPAVVRWLHRQTPRQMWSWFALMPILNLIPSIVLLCLPNPLPPFSFWGEFVMRTPLLWLPHFVMGVILARVFGITRHDMRWADRPDKKGPSWGDLAAVVLVAIMITPDEFFQQLLLLGSRSPHGLLRHGMLAPLHCTVIYHLALNRGWLAKCLSARILEILGEASFGIFILQGPLGFPFMMMLPNSWPPAMRLLLTILGVIGAAILSYRLFERPVARWLRKRLVIGAT